mgnify:CR=1 FL=1
MDTRRYDFLIVGAGLFGATFARIATDRGYRCLVAERRDVAGGNIRCEEIAGINVHRYGAHIFHTSDDEVWKFVSRYVDFNRFTNSPMARYGDKVYNLPFNMNTFCGLWGCTSPDEALAKLEEERADAASRLKANGVGEPRNLEEQALTLVGRDIYEKLIKGYTEKQWGRRCTELPAFIIRRLPVRLTFDNNYFNDKYQGIPVGGYNPLVDRLLEGSDVRLGCDFFEHREDLERVADKVVFTGKIDRYYGYCFGSLEYRSLRFEDEVLDKANYQGVAVVNYTEREPAWTRVIEHKHFECFGNDVYRNGRTVITREYPAEWCEGMEPFYPVNDDRNTRLYGRYKALADEENRVFFGGRLAEYRYYDMAPVVAQAMALADRIAPQKN